jgi:hypothetical protein
VALYISTIAEVSPSEVNPPITYTSSSKFADVTTVLGVGNGVPLVHPFPNIFSCAKAMLTKCIGYTKRNNENEISIM